MKKMSKVVMAMVLFFVSLGNVTQVFAQDNKMSDRVVRFAMVSEIDSLDPMQSSATDTGAMMNNIHDGLVDYNTAGEIIPSLAESWEISEDNLTYTFTLTEANFHNGNPVTAEDVVATYGPLAGVDGEEALSSKWEVVKSVEAIDEKTVEITLSSVDSGFLARTTMPVLPADYDDQANNPIGAGPFKFVEWNQGQSLVMERNEDYHNQDLVPQIAGVEWVLMQDPATITMALQTGEIDLAGTDLQGKEQLGDTMNYLEGPMNMPVIFGLNHAVEKFQDPLVRQAINLAINKEEIVDIVFQGNGVTLGSNFSPVMEFYYQDGLQETWAHDPEKAQELLTEAGVEDLSFVLKTPSHAQFYLDTAQVIQDQLDKVGIKVEIESVEWNTWLEEVYTNFDHEATLIGLTGKIDPYDVLIRFVDGYHRNFINYNNEEYNSVMESAIEELDDDKRAEHYKEAQTILAEDAASVFLMDPNRILAMQKDLSGLEIYPTTKYPLETLQVAE